MLNVSTDVICNTNVKYSWFRLRPLRKYLASLCCRKSHVVNGYCWLYDSG